MVNNLLILKGKQFRGRERKSDGGHQSQRKEDQKGGGQNWGQFCLPEGQKTGTMIGRGQERNRHSQFPIQKEKPLNGKRKRSTRKLGNPLKGGGC